MDLQRARIYTGALLGPDFANDLGSLGFLVDVYWIISIHDDPNSHSCQIELIMLTYALCLRFAFHS